jgi:predicted transcriptional regulator
MKTLEALKDQDLGVLGTPKRDTYEFDLQMEYLGRTIRKLRKAQHLSQKQLGERIGVQKAQISKLERNANNMTIDTIKKVFKALNSEIRVRVEFCDS